VRIAAVVIALFTPPALAADDIAAFDRAFKRYKAMDYYGFCSALGPAVRKKTQGPAERAARDVAALHYGVPPDDFGPIEARDLKIGMSLCAVVESQGRPTEVREHASRLGQSWSVWYRERRTLIYVGSDQRVTRFSR
jgi:hypothetical protein